MVSDPSGNHVGRLLAALKVETRRADDCERLLRERAEQIEDLRMTLAALKRKFPEMFAAAK